MKLQKYAIVLVAMLLSTGIASGAIVTPVSELHAMDETEFFGNSAAMDGNFTIVGARHDSDNGFKAGAAYVYNTMSGAQLYKLTPSDANPNDMFGSDVAVSGNYAVVGAIGKEDVATGTTNNYGAAYVFDLTTGAQVAKLVSSVELKMGSMGSGIAVDGNNVVVSGKWFDTGGGVNAGAVFRYELDNLVAHSSAAGTFVENEMLVSPRSGGPSFNFGSGMDIDGTTLIVGERASAFGNGIAGMAHLFDVSTGTLLGSFNGDDTNLSDSFGHSVTIEGNTAAVGSYSYNSAGVNSGTAYLFDVSDPTTVVQTFKLQEEDAGGNPVGGIVDNFGLHVELDDGTLLVSAQNDKDGFNNAGSAFLFDAASGDQLQKIFPSDPTAGALFGISIAISGDYLVVGGTGNTKAYIFGGIAAAAGDVNEDGDIDADDIDLMGDYIRTGIAPTAGNYDLSADGTTAGGDGSIDLMDLDFLVRFLVETSAADGDGNPIFGTQYGDFNLDGEIELGDLTRLGTYYGVGDKWSEGNANPHLDTDIELGDLTILGTYYGASNGGVDAIPEPASVSLLLLGASALLRRRRKV